MKIQTLQTMNECCSYSSLALMVSSRVSKMVRAVSNILKRVALIFRLLGQVERAKSTRCRN